MKGWEKAIPVGDPGANEDFAGRFQQDREIALSTYGRFASKITVQGNADFHLDLNTTHIHLTKRPRHWGIF